MTKGIRKRHCKTIFFCKVNEKVFNKELRNGQSLLFKEFSGLFDSFGKFAFYE